MKTEPTETPENFVITQRHAVSHVKRHFTFASDVIDLAITVNPKDQLDLTIQQLHIATVKIAIQHLQSLLPKEDRP